MVEGLAAAIDIVAERGAQSHRFLRFGWYAAALAAYGGQARTLVVEQEDAPVLALPFVPLGPRALRLATIPGCYWPFRSFGLALDAGEAALKTALSTLGAHVNGLRIGPVHDDDPAATALIAAARASGWAAIDRPIGQNWSLDLRPAADGQPWPRNSTLRKNRFHEKHLAEHGALDWRFLSGTDWPAAFAGLGAVEQTSLDRARHRSHRHEIHHRRPSRLLAGRGRRPGARGHVPRRAAQRRGAPAAFSFDIDAGALLYAIANSYDPRFAKQSPGKLLYWRNLVAAQARGIQRVDWGAGDSGYKQVIGATADAQIRDWILLRPGLPATIGRLLGRLWRRSGQRGR
ncbi:GNAT family N-acetyltransferase [Sphingomonas aurantiaca]|uniref:GNAT family N-acetyltransferase n=1 Tax=Sphingomonas aurantiaca TaxID=185949 RepID=UPI002FE0DAD3